MRSGSDILGRAIGHRALACALVSALCLVLAPAAAEAKKVSETADPVTVPDARTTGGGFPVVYGEATQTFTLKGSKVKGKQILDVNLVLNATEQAPFALFTLRIFLISPKGNEAILNSPSLASSWVDLKLDDQSDLRSCNPAQTVSADCNYWQGGTATGSVHADLNPSFKGANPKGTWTLLFQDQNAGNEPPTSIGTTTLEVKTGRKFEKESG